LKVSKIISCHIGQSQHGIKLLEVPQVRELFNMLSRVAPRLPWTTFMVRACVGARKLRWGGGGRERERENVAFVGVFGVLEGACGLVGHVGKSELRKSKVGGFVLGVYSSSVLLGSSSASVGARQLSQDGDK
jgi:hypothetical protein